MSAINPSRSEHVGTHFHDLSFSEQFVIWAIRMWMRASCQSPSLFQILGEAFQAIGLPEAGRALDKGMCILSIGTDREVMFFSPDNECLSRDECDFIRIIAAYQAKDTQQAEAFLGTWLPLAGTRIAGSAFSEFASHLATGGFSLIRAPKSATKPQNSVGIGRSPNSRLH